MSIVIKIALAYICLSAELCLVQSGKTVRALVAAIESVKNTVDNLQQQINGKIISMDEELRKMIEKKSNADHIVLENSLKTLENSVKEKLKEFQHQLTESGESSQKKHTFVLDSLDKLNNKVKSDFKANVDDFVQRITSLRTAKDEADKLLSEALSKIEKKSNADHVVLENSLKTLEKSVNEKLKEFQHQLTESGESSQEKHTFVLESLDKLNNKVKSDLKANVDDFVQHITSLRTAKDEADKLLKSLESVVEQIHTNTFNKESAVKAFLFLVVVVLFITVWVYRIQKTVTELKKCP